MKAFDDIENRCIGAVGTGGYYPLYKATLIKTDKIKNVPIGTYIGPDFKPVEFTPEERWILITSNWLYTTLDTINDNKNS